MTTIAHPREITAAEARGLLQAHVDEFEGWVRRPGVGTIRDGIPDELLFTRGETMAGHCAGLRLRVRREARQLEEMSRRGEHGVERDRWWPCIVWRWV